MHTKSEQTKVDLVWDLTGCLAWRDWSLILTVCNERVLKQVEVKTSCLIPQVKLVGGYVYLERFFLITRSLSSANPSDQKDLKTEASLQTRTQVINKTLHAQNKHFPRAFMLIRLKQLSRFLQKKSPFLNWNNNRTSPVGKCRKNCVLTLTVQLKIWLLDQKWRHSSRFWAITGLSFSHKLSILR